LVVTGGISGPAPEMPGADGANRASILAGLLAAQPDLVLVGEEPGRVFEVSWVDGRLQVRQSGTNPLDHESMLREEETYPAVHLPSLKKVLAAGSVPGEVGEWRRRQQGSAAMISRLLRLLAGVEDACLLELGIGPAPLGVALAASLTRTGSRVVLSGLDTSSVAVEAARLLAAALHIEADYRAIPIDAYEPSGSLDLLLALHVCGQAALDALALVLTHRIPRLVLVPCCPPEGSGPEAGLEYGAAAPYPVLRKRLDHLGFTRCCIERLSRLGYMVEVFDVYLRPWTNIEVGLAAYLPPT